MRLCKYGTFIAIYLRKGKPNCPVQTKAQCTHSVQVHSTYFRGRHHQTLPLCDTTTPFATGQLPSIVCAVAPVTHCHTRAIVISSSIFSTTHNLNNQSVLITPGRPSDRLCVVASFNHSSSRAVMMFIKSVSASLRPQNTLFSIDTTPARSRVPS